MVILLLKKIICVSKYDTVVVESHIFLILFNTVILLQNVTYFMSFSYGKYYAQNLLVCITSKLTRHMPCKHQWYRWPLSCYRNAKRFLLCLNARKAINWLMKFYLPINTFSPRELVLSRYFIYIYLNSISFHTLSINSYTLLHNN